MIDLKSLKKRDGRWLKLLTNKGNFTVDAIETIKGNVSPVLVMMMLMIMMLMVMEKMMIRRRQKI